VAEKSEWSSLDDIAYSLYNYERNTALECLFGEKKLVYACGNGGIIIMYSVCYAAAQSKAFPVYLPCFVHCVLQAQSHIGVHIHTYPKFISTKTNPYLNLPHSHILADIYN
jgi:hypothetical protein